MYSFKDRLIDWANQKGAWMHILVAVGITLLITAIILGAAMPSKGAVNTNKADVSQVKTILGTVVDGVATKASQAELNSVAGNVTDILDDQEGDINGLRSKVNTAQTRLNQARTDISTIQNSLAELSKSLVQAYLTGTFGNYVIHAKSSEAGTFTANVHLVYSAPIYVGNATTEDESMSAFYSGMDWTETTPSYATIATFNGTAWGISEVWFNTGIFQLEANDEKEINITCTGLNSTWEPGFAYVEVYGVNA